MDILAPEVSREQKLRDLHYRKKYHARVIVQNVGKLRHVTHLSQKF